MRPSEKCVREDIKRVLQIKMVKYVLGCVYVGAVISESSEKIISKSETLFSAFPDCSRWS